MQRTVQVTLAQVFCCLRNKEGSCPCPAEHRSICTVSSLRSPTAKCRSKSMYAQHEQCVQELTLCKLQSGKACREETFCSCVYSYVTTQRWKTTAVGFPSDLPLAPNGNERHVFTIRAKRIPEMICGELQGPERPFAVFSRMQR